MNLTRVLRPAQRILTAGVVAAVAATCLASAHGSDPVRRPARPVVELGATEQWQPGHSRPTESHLAKKESGAGLRVTGVAYAKKETGAGLRVTGVAYAKKETGAGLRVTGVAYAKKELRGGSSSPLLLVAQSAYPAIGRASYEKRVLDRVNKVRHQHDLRKLTVARCTDRFATRWSAHLAAADSFRHQSMTRLLNRCHAQYAGETLGRGTITPRTLVKMWMASPPHRHIILSHSPRRIGIGATPNSRGEWVVTANFMRF